MFPVLFSCGGLTVYSYGAMVAAGTLIAALCIRHHAQKKGISPDTITDVLFWIMAGGLVGGRIFYVLLHTHLYHNDPLDIIRLYKGGLAFHGSLIVGCVAAVISIKRYKLPLLKTMDIIVLYVPLAHAIGRVGCFLNGCCYGRPTRLPWGMTFPGHLVPVHPTQLYSALLLVIIFAILLLREHRQKFAGQIFFSYCMLYGLMRFFMEFLRGDNPAFIGVFSIFQLLSIFLFFGGLFFYLHTQSKQRST